MPLPCSCTSGTVCAKGTAAIGVCVPCPMGFYCIGYSYEPLRCTVGYYGAAVGFSSSTCSGPCTCSAGRYCAEGSTSALGSVCPASYVCAGGSGELQPCAVGLGFYCPAGTSMLSGAPCPTGGYYCAGYMAQPVARVCTTTVAGYAFNLTGLMRTSAGTAWSDVIPGLRIATVYFNFCGDQPSGASCAADGAAQGSCVYEDTYGGYYYYWYSGGSKNWGSSSLVAWALLDPADPCAGVTYSLVGGFGGPVDGGYCEGVSTVISVVCDTAVASTTLVLVGTRYDGCALAIPVRSGAGCCVGCPVGFGLSGGTCARCASGQYSGGTAPCALCPVGRYGAAPGLGVGCSGPCDAAPGNFCGAGSTTASPGTTCAAGFYCAGAAASPSPCTASPGYACSVGSSLSAGVPCTAGAYCAGGSAVSTPCTCYAGAYCPSLTSQAWGISCPAGSYCAGGTAAPLPCSCPTGYSCPVSSTSPSSSCLACPAGSYCTGGATIVVRKTRRRACAAAAAATAAAVAAMGLAAVGYVSIVCVFVCVNGVRAVRRSCARFWAVCTAPQRGHLRPVLHAPRRSFALVALRSL